MGEIPNESGKTDHQHGFPDDIFRASGEADDSIIHHIFNNETQATTCPTSPFGNDDQPLHHNDSVSSKSSSASSLDLSDQTEHREEPLLQHIETHEAKEEPLDVASSLPAQEAIVADEDLFNPKNVPPPIQVMDRSKASYDPARIPSSVFTPKSNSPMDWSAASNESLFSLHVGNNSFNKDNFFMMGADFQKYGDLLKSDDLQKSGDMFKSDELFSLSSSSPIPVIHMTDSGTPVVAKSSPSNHSNGETSDKFNQTPSLPVSTSTISSHSDGSGVSGASTSSFAFPILEEANRDSISVENEEPVNIPEKQESKTSIKSISEQFSSKIPSCSMCCCFCSCTCLSWRPQCPSCCCGGTHSTIS